MPTRIGELFEAYSCNVLCPCWIGQDPDLGECFAITSTASRSPASTCPSGAWPRGCWRGPVPARRTAWWHGARRTTAGPQAAGRLCAAGRPGRGAGGRAHRLADHPQAGAGAVTVRVGILPAMLGRDPGELLAEPGSSDADFVASGSGGEGCCERVGRLAAGWLCLLWSRVTALGGWVGFALGRLRKAGIWPIGRRDDGGSYVRGLVVVVFGVVVLALGLVLERLA